jgi:hypothetical protein
MRHRDPKRRRRAAVAAVALAATVVLGTNGAFAADDEEGVPLDTKLFRQLMKDLGLRRDGDAVIEYRERAPLVVPPSRSLPPPRDDSPVAANPAWPKDPDVAQRKADAVKQKTQARKTAHETMEAEGRPLSRDELDRGKVAATGSTAVVKPQDPDESARPLKPSELGGKNFFSGIFSSFSNNEGETGTFTGEPVRENLTAPPAGYQTPSPSQPYGLSPKNTKAKAATVEERASGYNR